MSKTKKLITTVIPFIREDGLKGVTTIALLQVTTTKKMSPKAILAGLIKCLTWWVKNTPEGKTVWEQSCKDLNIGDLACYEHEVISTLPHAKLTAQGIIDFKLLECGDSAEIVPFDRVLVDRDKLPEELR